MNSLARQTTRFLSTATAPPATVSAFTQSLTTAKSSSPSFPSLSPSLSSSIASSIPTTSTSTSSSPESTVLLSTLARLMMKSGKLTLAHSHLSLCLSHLSLTTSSPPFPLLSKALEIVSPSVRVVGRRKGTKSLPTPQPLTAEQRRRQAWKWIVEASEKREGQEKVFGKRLALEVLAVLGGQSEAIKKKEARHLQAMTGRANVPRG